MNLITLTPIVEPACLVYHICGTPCKFVYRFFALSYWLPGQTPIPLGTRDGTDAVYEAIFGLN